MSPIESSLLIVRATLPESPPGEAMPPLPANRTLPQWYIPEVQILPLNIVIGLCLKRAFDILVSSALLVVLSPLLLTLAMVIPLESPGFPIVIQRRRGLYGNDFGLLKFRTMVKHADGMQTVLESRNEARGLLFKIRKDPRVTRLGRFLRRSSIDELPQLINVVRGQMSLIGPRPFILRDFARPCDHVLYPQWLVMRHALRPGISGLWQIKGRSDLAQRQLLRLDIFYVMHWSLRLDLYILWRTLPAVIQRRGAY